MRHTDVWRAIDALAERHGLTASALARRAGLDATAFNRSKRENPDGQRPRWPSTESIAKALDAVGESFDTFAELLSGERGGRAVPVIGLAQAGSEGFFDDVGFPLGHGWDEVRFPGLGNESVYALEIQGESMEPVYRAGDRIIVAPGVSLRRGDRVVARTRSGDIMAKVLGSRTQTRIELLSFNPAFPPRDVPVQDLSWMARIMWASQ
jgi:phage repressor protein C with HTH and peptisase S24 domain